MTLAIVTNCVNVIIAERAKMTGPSGFDDDNILCGARAAVRAGVSARTTLVEHHHRRGPARASGDPRRARPRRTRTSSCGKGRLVDVDQAGGHAAERRSARRSTGRRQDIFETLGVQIIEGRGFARGRSRHRHRETDTPTRRDRLAHRGRRALPRRQCGRQGGRRGARTTACRPASR